MGPSWIGRCCRGLLVLGLLLGDLPAFASSLAAWRVTRQGNLELRTTPNISLKAYYEAGSGRRGPRVGVDLPGAPKRTRTIRGSGAIREVRIAQVLRLNSLLRGVSGVRPIRNSSAECAPATLDLDSSIADGRSSECVNGTFRPMPPVPEVPTFR